MPQVRTAPSADNRRTPKNVEWLWISMNYMRISMNQYELDWRFAILCLRSDRPWPRCQKVLGQKLHRSLPARCSQQIKQVNPHGTQPALKEFQHVEENVKFQKGLTWATGVHVGRLVRCNVEGIWRNHIRTYIIWTFAIILLYYLYLIVFICVYTIYYLWIITVQPSYYYSTCYDITGTCIVCVFLCLSNWCPNIPTIEARLLSRSCPSQTFSYCCEKEAGIGNLQDILNQIVLDHARPTYFKIMSACIICCNLDSWSTLVLSGYLSKCIPSYSPNQLKASESVTKCKQSLHEDSDTPKSCWRRPIGEKHSRLGGLAEWHRTFG